MSNRSLEGIGRPVVINSRDSGRLAPSVRGRAGFEAMRIYVGDALLLESKQFSGDELLDRIKQREGADWKRDRDIFFWALPETVYWERMTDVSPDITQSIIVSGTNYDMDRFSEDFSGKAISPPTGIIRISGYYSNLLHNISSVKAVCEQLGKMHIDYLVNPCREPAPENVEWASEAIKKSLLIRINEVPL